jgi:hypothetical protein
VWNERSWGSIDYVVSLRNALDAAGLAATRIVVPDGGACDAVTAAAASNATFQQAIYALGEHYPCKRSCPATAATGLKFWAGEDYSTVADWAGAGCLGRSLGQNWVLLNSTSTISWSTIWSVYTQDSYFGNGLMYGPLVWPLRRRRDVSRGPRKLGVDWTVARAMPSRTAVTSGPAHDTARRCGAAGAAVEWIGVV